MPDDVVIVESVEVEVVRDLDGSGDVLSSPAEQGLPGPPGPRGQGYERALLVDTSSNPWYVAYPSRIARIDPTVSPMTVQSFETSSPLGDWNLRQTLDYV